MKAYIRSWCMVVCWILVAHTGHTEPLFVKFGILGSFPADCPTAQSLQVFQKTISTTLGAQLTLQIFPDGQLGSAVQMMEGLQFGNIEMGILPAEVIISRLPVLSSVSMPYIFRNNEHRFRVLDGPIGKQLLSGLEELNLLGLGFLDTGMKGFITRTDPLRAPKDFQGQHIGIIRFCPRSECLNMIHQLSEYHLKTLGATGTILSAEAIAVPWEAGTLSGIEYTPLRNSVPKLPTSAPLYLTKTAHTTVPDLIIVSKRWFETLEPSIQQALAKASSHLVKDQRARFAQAEKQEYTALQTQGVVLNDIVAHEDFWEAVQPVYRQMRERIGTEFTVILDAIKAVR